jgi:hypothetical protein
LFSSRAVSDTSIFRAFARGLEREWVLRRGFPAPFNQFEKWLCFLRFSSGFRGRLGASKSSCQEVGHYPCSQNKKNVQNLNNLKQSRQCPATFFPEPAPAPHFFANLRDI